MKYETILAMFAGGVGLMFGSNSDILKIVAGLVIIMGFDLLTGIVKAMYNKNIKSSIWIDGFIRKILMLLCVCFCYYADKFGFINLGVSLESASALFFMAGEVVSVFENFVDLGIPLPKILIDFLAKNTASKANETEVK